MVMKKRKYVLVSLLGTVVLVSAICFGYADDKIDSVEPLAKNSQTEIKTTLIKDSKEQGSPSKETAKAGKSDAKNNKASSIFSFSSSESNAKVASPKNAASSNKTSSSVNTSKGTSTTTSSDSSSKTEQSKPTATNPQTHTHSWVAVYGAREVPVYESRRVVICDDCGAIVSGSGGMTPEQRSEHMNMHLDNGDPYGGGTHSETRIVLVGTTTEQYITGYKCSCGETK